MSKFETIDLTILENVTGGDANSGQYCKDGLKDQFDASGQGRIKTPMGFEIEGGGTVSSTTCNPPPRQRR